MSPRAWADDGAQGEGDGLRVVVAELDEAGLQRIELAVHVVVMSMLRVAQRPDRGAGARACPRRRDGVLASQRVAVSVGRPRGSRARARRTPGETCPGLPTARRPIPCARSRLARGAPAGPVDVPRGPPPPGRAARPRPPTAGGRRACPRASWCRRGTAPTSRSMSTSPPATRATSRAEPEPSTASASRPARSAGDNPATISSHRNCRVAPGGADRTSRTSDGHPANPSHAAWSSPSDRASASTSASVNASASPPISTTWPGGASPSERHRQRFPAGEHEVRVGRQPRRQLADELLAGRHRRELVQVVDDDADVQRGSGAQRTEDAVDVCCHPGTVTPSADKIADDKRAASSSPGSQATQASMPRGAASLARIACASAVVLPNPAPATTRRDRHVEAGRERFEQVCPDELVFER